MTHSDVTPQTPRPQQPAAPPPQPPARSEPATPPEADRYGLRDSIVLIGLLAVCAGVYLTVGATGFAGVISAVTGLYGAWRMRR
ncbi:hypothetical protein [Streptomyces chryseus]|uniref:hypothetical protein n=1 Tax=Streptomyces chryseus TaxID=68186 RepID=UPI0016720AF9|nr:hypothetical protein [Streptomyces chryseus]GGX47606.1 hypothetical protein GCM10010353_72250 [Streptomyces chryseus]